MNGWSRNPHQIVDGIEKKFCNGCRDYLSLDLFYNCSGAKDKKSSRCKKCCDRYVKEDNTKDSERFTRERQEHFDRGSLWCSRCHQYLEFKEFAEYNLKNDYRIGICRSCQKKARESNLEHYLEYDKLRMKNKAQYYQENKQQINLQRRINENRRYHSDPLFKMKKLLRNRLTTGINRKRLSERKSSHIKNLGCTIEFLKSYLESKFYNHPVTGLS